MCDVMAQVRRFRREPVAGRWGQSLLLVLMVLVAGAAAIAITATRKEKAKPRAPKKMAVEEVAAPVVEIRQALGVPKESRKNPPLEPRMTDPAVAEILDRYGLRPETFGVRRRED